MAANNGFLAGKVLFITGASRGIGRAIALKAAKDGAKIAIIAKTKEPHPKLPGTIYSVAEEVLKAGGQALPCVADLRYEDQVAKAVEETVNAFGGIDILVNNASAISLTNTEATPMKTYDLMMGINARGTFLCSKLCLPYLKASGKSPHILNISPPLNMSPRWFSNHVAYTCAKYGMSLSVLGMSGELAQYGIAVNALWPRTAIYTAAMRMLAGGNSVESQCRKPEIMADAAYVILRHRAGDKLPSGIENHCSLPVTSTTWTGQFFIDDNVLTKAGNVVDLETYSCIPGSNLLLDFFLDPPVGDSAKSADKPVPTKSACPIEATFSSIASQLNSEMVATLKSTYKFVLSESGCWFLDLKNGNGSCGRVDESNKSSYDCTLTLSSEDFVKMFSGKLAPTVAFMNGQLRIDGNISAAMKLEKFMKSMQKSSKL